MLLNVLQIVVRSMFYCFITWHRYAPEGGIKAGRMIGQGTRGQAKR